MSKIWSRWLMLLGDFMILFGLAMLFLPAGALFAPINGPTWLALLGSETPAAQVLAYHGLLFGLAGSATVGWGVLVALIAWRPFARGERWAWWALTLSFTAWFVLDTVHVLAAGATMYGALNALLALAALPPLLATVRAARTAAKIPDAGAATV